MKILFIKMNKTKFNKPDKIEEKQFLESFSKCINVNFHIQYLIYLPEDYSKSKKKWPLVLFLHGSGERGSDINLVKRNGPPKMIEEGIKFPFILISPQCPNDEEWSIPMLKLLLKNIEKKYRIDKTREYLTGLSMGGFGTWKLAIAMPNKFAAIIPVCGGGDASMVKVLKNIPIWIFHGENDNIVPIERAKVMFKALKQTGNNKVKFTIYPKTGHDSWTQTYKNPKIYKWLLRHKLY